MMDSNPQPVNVFPAYDKKRRSSTGLRKLLYRTSPFPLHTLHPLYFETRLFLVRLQHRLVRRKLRGASGLKVNLGAGPYGKPGWVNIDAFDAPGITFVYDCRKSLPFDTNSVDCVFCEHMFEHIDYTEEAPHFLAECHRVLQPGGVLRIVVPDAGRYLEAYCEQDWRPLELLRGLGSDHTDLHLGGRYDTKMELINVLFDQAGQHKFLYDYETLALSLDRAGFSHVERQTYGESLHEGLAIDHPDRATESLYVDAVK